MRGFTRVVVLLSLVLAPVVARAQQVEPVPPVVAPPPPPPTPPTPEARHEHDHDDDDDGDDGVDDREHGEGGGGRHRDRHHRGPGERASRRPEGRAVGIGAGYTFPADLQAPNTTTVRFRLSSGLTLEPLVVIGANGQSSDPGDGSSSAFELTLGGLARVPLASRGRVDLVFLAGGAATVGTNNPDGDENDTTAFGLALTWGLAVEYWFGPHVALSMNALNPFASYTHSSTEQAFGDDTSQSSWRIGAIFDPTVGLMLHVFW